MRKLIKACWTVLSVLLIFGLFAACANSSGSDGGGSGTDATPLFDKSELDVSFSDSGFTLNDGTYKYKEITTHNDGVIFVDYYEFSITEGILTITKGSYYTYGKITEELLQQGIDDKPITREEAVAYIQERGGKVNGDTYTYLNDYSADDLKETEQWFMSNLEYDINKNDAKTNTDKSKFYYKYTNDSKGYTREYYLVKTSSPNPSQTTTQQNAVYVCERTDTNPNLGLEVTMKMTATFKNDGTFSVSQKMKMMEMENDLGVVMKGTYTGNAAVDGTVTITITHMMNDDGELAAYTDSDATQTVTISNGKCTFDEMEFVRQ